MQIVTKRTVYAPLWYFPKGTIAEIKCIGNFGSVGLSLEGEALDSKLEVKPFLMVVPDLNSSEEFEAVQF